MRLGAIHPARFACQTTPLARPTDSSSTPSHHYTTITVVALKNCIAEGPVVENGY